MNIIKGFEKEIQACQDKTESEAWKILCASGIYDVFAPASGLDHMVISKNQVILYDIGCNGRDNSVTLRK
jgi:hypothetical protein